MEHTDTAALQKNNYEQPIRHGILYGRQYEKNNSTTAQKSRSFTTAEISTYIDNIIPNSTEITPKEEKSFFAYFAG